MNFKENESQTKLRGGYYTSPEIATFLLRWVAGRQPQTLLEPSCGDGVFFRQMASLPQFAETVATGFEIDEEEAAKARESGRTLGNRAEVHARDFLGWALTRIARPDFDAVVGNPPFIR